jgi:RNA polymerase sigma-70 factor (ECF subfamily)
LAQQVPSDTELIERFSDPGRRNIAFKDIVEKYQKRLYKVVKRLVNDHDDTEDVLQNTFIKAWQKLEGFRGESALSTWLHRIAMNEALNHLNSARVKKTQNIDNQIHQPIGGQGFSSDEGDELVLKLEKAINLLPPRQKAVFCLRYYDEVAYEEMAKILNLSEGALKATYHHAVKKIEQHLTAH